MRYVSNVLLSKAYHSISKWKNYKATPLLSLDILNQNLSFNKIFYKDESKRFHLKSFKALGGAYAVEKITKGNKEITAVSYTHLTLPTICSV